MGRTVPTFTQPTHTHKPIMVVVNFSTNNHDIIIEKKNRKREEWKVKASIVAKNTFNPIRNILETMVIEPNPDKKMISLSIGDPTEANLRMGCDLPDLPGQWGHQHQRQL